MVDYLVYEIIHVSCWKHDPFALLVDRCCAHVHVLNMKIAEESQRILR